MPAKNIDNADLIVPLELQAGFALPNGVDTSRFLLAFGNCIPPFFQMSRYCKFQYILLHYN